MASRQDEILYLLWSMGILVVASKGQGFTQSVLVYLFWNKRHILKFNL